MKWVFTVLFVIGISMIAYVWPRTESVVSPIQKAKVMQEDAPLSSPTFEIVDSPEERTRGLSGRREVPQSGMLFVFPQKDIQSFWMKDMLISIDMIWLDDDGTILGIEESVSPSTYPEVFSPSVPVRYVLETRPGEALRQGWRVGSIIALPK